MKVKTFKSGSRDNRYVTIRIPQQLTDKYSLDSCLVDVTDSEENNGILIKRVI
jgi:hypothetical protein